MAPSIVFLRAASLLIVATASWLSLAPNPPRAPEGVAISDLVVHFLMHFGMAGSLLLGWPDRRTVWIVIALAAGLEIAQLGIPGREFDLRDMAANFSGAAVAGALLALSGRRRARG
jgi:VanZ family protein